jgi:regulator of extracellular matrix RemA (YlzA/DUF370 family)
MTVSLMKPVRVIQELTPDQQLCRAMKRLLDQQDAHHKRIDADYGARMRELVEQFAAAPVAAPEAVTSTG